MGNISRIQSNCFTRRPSSHRSDTVCPRWWCDVVYFEYFWISDDNSLRCVEVLCYHHHLMVIFTWNLVSSTDWGRVTHICVSKLNIIGSDSGLSPGRCQAFIWINGEILLIGRIRRDSNEILIGVHALSFIEIHLKMSPGKWRPFCLGRNESIPRVTPAD